MLSRAVIACLGLLAFYSAASTANECIPVLETSLSKSGDTDLSMNDAFNTVMSEMVPLFVYLDVTLGADQDHELAQGPDKTGSVYFSVKGANGDMDYYLHLGKSGLTNWYSAKTRILTGYWEIYSVEGPYQGNMVVALRPFTPTLKKCARDTSGPHAYH